MCEPGKPCNPEDMQISLEKVTEMHLSAVSAVLSQTALKVLRRDFADESKQVSILIDSRTANGLVDLAKTLVELRKNMAAPEGKTKALLDGVSVMLQAFDGKLPSKEELTSTLDAINASK